MAASVAAWGNSDAIRIPRDMLRLAGVSHGDKVDLAINERGLIEVVPQRRVHRRVLSEKGVTFARLFKDYEGPSFDNADAWPDDELRGAEKDAWLS